MDNNGITHPFIPYYHILDVDIGLFAVLRDKYKNPKIFGTGILEAPVEFQRYFLWKRGYENPLQAIARDPDDKELYDDYYNQFMEDEIDYILKHSTATGIYDILRLYGKDTLMNITVWTPTERIKQFLLQADRMTFSHVSFAVSDSWGKSVGEVEQPIYVKFATDIARYYRYLVGRSLYISSYGFNEDDNPDPEEPFTLRKDILTLLQGSTVVQIMDPYREDEYKIITA